MSVQPTLCSKWSGQMHPSVGFDRPAVRRADQAYLTASDLSGAPEFLSTRRGLDLQSRPGRASPCQVGVGLPGASKLMTENLWLTGVLDR